MTDHPLWLRSFWQLHRVVDRLSGGRFGARVTGIPVVWLTTIGRTTGTVRTNAQYYVADGPNLVVVASNAGLDVEPDWWLNLRAHPDTTARTGQQTGEVHARRATADERTGLWPRLVALYPEYAAYRARTTRQVPVAILEPRRGS